MAEDNMEKETRTRIDTGSGEAERDVRTARSSDDRDRDRDYDYDDDDRSRRRRDVRDSGRSARRVSTDFLTLGCDILGDLLVGFGEALTPRRRSSRSRDDEDDDRGGRCGELGFEMRTYSRSDEDDDQGGGGSDSNRGSSRRDSGGRGIRYESRSYQRSDR